MTCRNPACNHTNLYARGFCRRCYSYQRRNSGEMWTPAPQLVTLRELDTYILEHDERYGYVPSSRKLAAQFEHGERNYVLGLLNELRARGRLRKVGRRGGARWVVVHHVVHHGELDSSNGRGPA